MLLSEKTGIPYLILMNSWDNPSQKAAVTGAPTCLAVWGEQTRGHALRYMRLPPDRIAVLGAAQFELYNRPVKESEDSLRRDFGVPYNKKILLYGGVSKSINETRHLQILDEAIENGSIPDCHVLYRPHPWRGALVEGEVDFFKARFRHVTMDPHMEVFYRQTIASPSGRFDMADYKIAQKLLHIVAGTISTLSTIQLETLLHGKPAIAFLPPIDRTGSATDPTHAHFRDLWESPGMILCETDASLIDEVNRLLDMSADAEMREAIRAHAQTFVVVEQPTTYGRRVRDLALKLVNENKDASDVPV
jgi:hypothetical protein